MAATIALDNLRACATFLLASPIRTFFDFLAFTPLPSTPDLTTGRLLHLLELVFFLALTLQLTRWSKPPSSSPRTRKVLYFWTVEDGDEKGLGERCIICHGGGEEHDHAVRMQCCGKVQYMRCLEMWFMREWATRCPLCMTVLCEIRSLGERGQVAELRRITLLAAVLEVGYAIHYVGWLGLRLMMRLFAGISDSGDPFQATFTILWAVEILACFLPVAFIGGCELWDAAHRRVEEEEEEEDAEVVLTWAVRHVWMSLIAALLFNGWLVAVGFVFAATGTIYFLMKWNRQVRPLP